MPCSKVCLHAILEVVLLPVVLTFQSQLFWQHHPSVKYWLVSNPYELFLVWLFIHNPSASALEIDKLDAIQVVRLRYIALDLHHIIPLSYRCTILPIQLKTTLQYGHGWVGWVFWFNWWWWLQLVCSERVDMELSSLLWQRDGLSKPFQNYLQQSQNLICTFHLLLFLAFASL